MWHKNVPNSVIVQHSFVDTLAWLICEECHCAVKSVAYLGALALADVMVEVGSLCSAMDTFLSGGLICHLNTFSVC